MLRGFILLLFILSFFCGIASLFGDDWASIRHGSRRDVNIFLWGDCWRVNNTIASQVQPSLLATVDYSICREYGLEGELVEDLIIVTRWIMVGALAVGVVTFLLLILAVREDALSDEEKGNVCSSNFLIVFWLELQGLALVAAMAVFTQHYVSDLKDGSYTLGWSYALGWASAGVFILSGCILTIGGCVSGDCQWSDDDE